MPRALAVSILGLLPFLALAACEGCRGTNAPRPRDGTADVPSARLYLVSNMAGALEPCGCVKDQPGGMDRFGALVAADRKKLPVTATLSAGPLFFMDPQIPDDRKAQETTKAETIAQAMKMVGLAAFTPGKNDAAAGDSELAKLTEVSAAAIVRSSSGPRARTLQLGPMKLGVVGVDTADADLGGAIAAVKKEGANAIVALTSVGRGEAKRIADRNPELLAIVVGAASSSGDTNEKAAPAERIGDVLVVEAGNHLQSVGVLDLFLRSDAQGFVHFADGTGIERTRKRDELGARVDELRAKIATWETDKSVEKKDVDARRADLAKLEEERRALEQSPAPATGSFFHYATREVREELGADDTVKSAMRVYYKKVNDDNRAAFASKMPAPVSKGEAKYLGVEACTNCHDAPRAVWDKTSHAKAYATLSTQFKEFNLDCVGCHVTGYDRPGGSTVTHVDDLKDVQCEVCHGPGSLHFASPEKVKMPVPKPGAEVCTSCHHPPHVHAFDAAVKMAEILGPGHGKPK